MASALLSVPLIASGLRSPPLYFFVGVVENVETKVSVLVNVES